MFNEDEIVSFKKPAAEVQPSSKRPFVRWEDLPVEDLIEIRNEIDLCLPALTLKDLNLEQQLLLQLHAMRVLQGQVLHDPDIQLNQRATVANTVASTLNKLAEMQERMYNSERFKNVENLMVRTLSKMPEDMAKAFLDEYERILENQ